MSVDPHPIATHLCACITMVPMYSVCLSYVHCDYPPPPKKHCSLTHIRRPSQTVELGRHHRVCVCVVGYIERDLNVHPATELC